MTFQIIGLIVILGFAAFIASIALKKKPAPPVVYQPPSAPYQAGPEVKWPDDQAPPGPMSN